MKNKEIANALHEISVLLEIEGKDRFKPRAYARAARSIEALGEDIEAIASRNELTNIPGVGKSIAELIETYLQSGVMPILEELRKKIPVKVSELEAIPGVGPKTIRLLYDKLKITDLTSLEQAIKDGNLNGLRGIGSKTISQIIEGIKLVRSGLGRILLSDALAIAEKIVTHIKSQSPVKRIDIVGSVRRRCETVGDIDILVLTSDAQKVMDAFVTFQDIKDVLARGDTKTSIRLSDGLQVDLRIIPPESYGAGLQYFTGSKDHNVHLRSIAQRKGLKLNEYGLFKAGVRIAGSSEPEIYQKLGLQFIPPELREDSGEFEAAEAKNLPRLIELSDIRGDLHSHTNQTDGVNSLEEMAAAAAELGYEYFCISDHTQGMAFVNGLNEEQILQQIDLIDDLNNSGRWRMCLLSGAEVNILSNGELDIDDGVLAQLDIVIVSIHSWKKEAESKMTERVCQALQNKHVNILGHPTGRLLLKRAPYKINLVEVFEMAKKNNVALEVNGYPQRLDLSAPHLRTAVSMGVKITINTDAHKISEIPNNMKFGVFQARRGWVSREDVLNTYPLPELIKFFK